MGPDITRKSDELLMVAKDVILSRLESCDTENKDLLLAVLWLLLANSLLGSVWNSSDANIIVKYVESCIVSRCDEFAHVVTMVSYYYS